VFSLFKAFVLFGAGLLASFGADASLKFDAKSVETLYLSSLLPSSEFKGYKHQVTVTTSKELQGAVKRANQKGNTLILLSAASYRLNQTIVITGSRIAIMGMGKTPFDTVLTGNGMKSGQNIDNLFHITGNQVHLENFTLEQAGNHLVQISNSEGGAYGYFKNLVFQDAYQQLFKVSYDESNSKRLAKFGVVESCLFRYSGAAGPNWYIGGIDAHGIKKWQIKKNVFHNIASPGESIAEHAIHIWDQSEHNVVENNLIVNSDRGIGFGMRLTEGDIKTWSNLGGKIQDNAIYHEDNEHPFSDVGIILEDSPGTQVSGNVIYHKHWYPNAIEVRFPFSTGVTVERNVSNRLFRNRNGAGASFEGNQISVFDIETHFLEVLLQNGF